MSKSFDELFDEPTGFDELFDAPVAVAERPEVAPGEPIAPRRTPEAVVGDFRAKEGIEPVEEFGEFPKTEQKFDVPKSTFDIARFSQELADGGLEAEEERLQVEEKPIGFWENLFRRPLEKIPFSAFGAGRALGAYAAARRLKTSPQLTDWERRIFPEKAVREYDERYNRNVEIIETYLKPFIEEEERGLTTGAKISGGISQLPAFAIEFLLTGGLATGAKKGAKKIASKAVGRLIRKRAVKLGISVLGAAAGAGVRTFAMPHRVVEGAIQRMMPQIGFMEDGIMIVGETSEKPATAFLISFADVFIENFSETAGPTLGRGVKKVLRGTGKILGKFPLVKGPARKVMRSLEKQWRRLGPLRTSADWEKHFSKVGFHGVIEEMEEEQLGRTLREAFGIGQSEQGTAFFNRLLNSVPNAEQLLIEMGIFIVPGAARVGVSQVAQKVTKEAIEEAPSEQITPTPVEKVAEEGVQPEGVPTEGKEITPIEPTPEGEVKQPWEMTAEELLPDGWHFEENPNLKNKAQVDYGAIKANTIWVQPGVGEKVKKHEIAHVLLNTLSDEARKTILDKYATVSKVTDWEIKHGFYQEKFAIQFGEFLDGELADGAVKNFFTQNAKTLIPSVPTPEVKEKPSDIQERKAEKVPVRKEAPRGEEVGEAPKEEKEAGPLNLTAIKNERIDAELKELGLPPPKRGESKQFKEEAAKATQRAEKDPHAAQRLVSELDAQPRPISIEEDFTLLHEETRLKNERDVAEQQYINAVEAGDEVSIGIAQARRDKAVTDFISLGNAVTQAGTRNAQALAARRVLMKSDFSLSSMERQRQVARGGKDLTEEQKAQVKELHDQIDALDKEYAAFLKKNTKPTDSPEQRKAILLSDEAIDVRFRLDTAHRQWGSVIQKDKGEQRALLSRSISGVGEALQLSRSIITSFDLSGLFRQGGWALLSHPVSTIRAARKMFRSAISKKNQFAIDEEIKLNDNYKLSQKAGLFLAEHGHALGSREEVYMSRWAEKIPGVAASERAYTTILNVIRMQEFDRLVKTLSRGGEVTLDEAKAIAAFVNTHTGRGGSRSRRSAWVGLNQVFFAPRWVASRFQLLLGQPAWRGSNRTRKLIAIEYARAIAGLGTVYALAAAAMSAWGDDDDKIELDPRSADFGKVKVGNTRIDPMIGLSQVIVFMSRIASGQTKDSRGRIVPLRGKDVPFGRADTADIIFRFGRSKLNPVFGAAINISSGENVVGEQVTFGTVASDLLVPMAFKDAYEAMQDMGYSKGAALGLLAIFGVSLQTYETRTGMTSRLKTRK